MKIITIIGAGQIGSRHLQGILKSNKSLDIYIQDPSKKSIENAKNRLSEIEYDKTSKSIHFVDCIDHIPNTIDLAIIATNANVRYQVIEELLSKKKLIYIVLEKVLFQEPKAYSKAYELIKKHKVKCWVNHPRRMSNFYQQLKTELSCATRIDYQLHGGNWGLACNGLHFIDHFCFLTNFKSINFNQPEINQIIPSKREGFVDIFGKVEGSIDSYKFTLNSFEDTSPSLMSIHSDVIVALIDETSGYARVAKKSDNWRSKVYQKKIINYQSELSHIFLDSILDTEKCLLPTFDESYPLHEQFVSLILEKINTIQKTNHTRCPIT